MTGMTGNDITNILPKETTVTNPILNYPLDKSHEVAAIPLVVPVAIGAVLLGTLTLGYIDWYVKQNPVVITGTANRVRTWLEQSGVTNIPGKLEEQISALFNSVKKQTGEYTTFIKDFVQKLTSGSNDSTSGTRRSTDTSSRSSSSANPPSAQNQLPTSTRQATTATMEAQIYRAGVSQYEIAQNALKEANNLISQINTAITNHEVNKVGTLRTSLREQLKKANDATFLLGGAADALGEFLGKGNATVDSFKVAVTNLNSERSDKLTQLNSVDTWLEGENKLTDNQATTYLAQGVGGVSNETLQREMAKLYLTSFKKGGKPITKNALDQYRYDLGTSPILNQQILIDGTIQALQAKRLLPAGTDLEDFKKHLNNWCEEQLNQAQLTNGADAYKFLANKFSWLVNQTENAQKCLNDLLRPSNPISTANPSATGLNGGAAEIAAQPITVGYFDPSTGTLSDTPGPGAIPVSAQWVDRLPSDSSGVRFELRVDPDTGRLLEMSTGNNAERAEESRESGSAEAWVQRLSNGGVRIDLYASGSSGGPDKDPKNKKDPNWWSLAAPNLIVGGMFLYLNLEQKHDSYELNRTLVPDFNKANSNVTALIDNFTQQADSEKQIKDARELIWNSYFTAANTALENYHYAKAYNIFGGEEMFTPNEMEIFEKAKTEFLQSIANLPVASPDGRSSSSGFQPFTYPPTGHPEKDRILLMVSQQLNEQARSALDNFAAKVIDPDPKISSFVPQNIDVAAYIKNSGVDLGSEAGRKAAMEAVWDYYLTQISSALESGLSKQEISEFDTAKKRWLNSDLDERDLSSILPGNSSVQAMLQRILPQARMSLQVLESKFTGNDAFNINQILPDKPKEDSMRVINTSDSVNPADAGKAPNPNTNPNINPNPNTNTSANDAVMTEIRAALNQAGINTFANIRSIDELHFNTKMFFESGQEVNTDTIQQAYKRAVTLFEAISKVAEKQSGTTKVQLAAVLDRINQEVLAQLNVMSSQISKSKESQSGLPGTLEPNAEHSQTSPPEMNVVPSPPPSPATNN